MENDYMNQKIATNDAINQRIEKKDYIEPIKDYTTDWGKGIRFYTCDGKEVATMEQVMQYNQMYYETMMIKVDNTEKKSGMRR